MEQGEMIAYSETRGSNLFVKKLLDEGLRPELDRFKEIRQNSSGIEIYNGQKNKLLDVESFYCPKCERKKLRIDHKREVIDGIEGIGNCSILCGDCDSKFLPREISDSLEFGVVGNDRGDYMLDFYLLMFSPNEYVTRNFCSGVLSSKDYLPLEYFKEKGILNRFDVGSFSTGSWGYIYGLNMDDTKGYTRLTKERNKAKAKYNGNDFLLEKLLEYLTERKDMVGKFSEEVEINVQRSSKEAEKEYPVGDNFIVRRLCETEEDQFKFNIKHTTQDNLQEIWKRDRESTFSL